MNSKTIYLKLSKETPKIILTSDTGFEKIEMLEVVGNQINKLDAPLGIRWTLFCSQNQYDCFCWQLPGKFEFNCFELMNVYGSIDSEIAKNYIANQSCELHISMENRVFEEGMKIGIRLGIIESDAHT